MKKLKFEYIRSDNRGKLIQVVTGQWKQLNHLKLSRGGFLGGHYHKLKKEFFYLIKGEVMITIEFHIGNSKDDCANISMLPGDCLLIEPFEKHTIYPLKNSEFIELLSEPYNEQDTYVD